VAKTFLRVLSVCAFALGVFLAPATALADSSLPTSQWNFYQYANEQQPATSFQQVIHIKNNSTVSWDSISASVPNLAACILVTGVAVTYDSTNASFSGPATFPSATCTSGVSGFSVGGSSANSLNLLPGKSVTIFLNATVSCIYSSPPSCDPDPMHTTSNVWQNAHYVHFGNGGSTFQQFDFIGNTTLKITNTPNPMQQPLDWGRDNPYATGLNNTQIASPTAISGLFPPGPIDSLLTLPITLMNQILTAASGSVTLPTTTVFGRTMTFPTSAGIYGVIGTTGTGLMSAGLTFFLLFPWLKSIYGRLQRATSLESHHNDTWGAL
jgi:hypothetical protein